MEAHLYGVNIDAYNERAKLKTDLFEPDLDYKYHLGYVKVLGYPDEYFP